MQNLAMLVGRILMSAIFIQASYSKLMNIGGTIGYFEAVGLPMPNLAIWGVIAIELLGGLAILLGFQTRIVAVILGLFSIAAGAIGHSDINDLMHFQALMKDIAIGGGFLYIAANGAGAFSIDAKRTAYPA
jgi:putative oxidoreductase